jgi:OHS family lactose permease-like MFS transporter
VKNKIRGSAATEYDSSPGRDPRTWRRTSAVVHIIKTLTLHVGEDDMKNTSTNNRTEYYKISSFIFLYFFTWSASIGLLAIWLGQKANLSGTVIGTVFAVNGVFSVILKPIYGYILDKIGMSKYLLYFVVAMSALMAPFFIYVYQPLLMSNTLLGIILGALYLSFAWYAGVAACESYSDRLAA